MSTGLFEEEKKLAAHIAEELNRRMPLVKKNTEESTQVLSAAMNSVKKHEVQMAEMAHYAFDNLERATRIENGLKPLDGLLKQAEQIKDWEGLQHIVVQYRNIHGLDLKNFNQKNPAKPQLVTALQHLTAGEIKKVTELLKSAETLSDKWLEEAKKHDTLCGQLKQAASSVKL